MVTAAKNSAEKSAAVSAKDSGSGVTVIEAVSPAQLGEVFRTAGYRVTLAEQNGRMQLMSASQGVGFAVRFGNPAAETDTHVDYTMSCAMQVQGELPVDLVPSWNRTKRFARLAAHQQFLLLEMDVLVAGGVTTRYLRSTIELWDRLMQEFLLHLRTRPTMAAAQAAAQVASVPSAVEPAAEAAQDTAAAEDGDAQADQQ